MNVINALDLEPIKVKLMHKESGEGWSLERANAIETEYRRFLFLMKQFPNEQTAPLVDVDTFWHYHILDTMKYAADCDAVFGHFLHHFPYIGLRGEDDLVAHERLGHRMQELYEATFGESYLRGAAHQDVAYSAAPGATAYSAAPGVAANTAYSAAPGVAAKTAYSAAPGVVAQTAYSAKIAYSAAPGVTAYSAAPGKVAQGLQTAADAGAIIDQARVASFYSDRPRLAPSA
ncbi:glycine-rich domain-containing protein [Duganella sp. S19_KUP01_CR8]|uniref:glycine-rich domain-containing protein n=1 Tax=Duganella sp. S19_KUP01_CR8 TaxID=3025502 RepID=UPI002FCDC27E